MSGEVGQWDLEVCAVFFFLSPSLLILSCQWKMSNAIRRREDDELERVSKKRATERKKKDRRQAEWWFGPLTGPLPAD